MKFLLLQLFFVFSLFGFESKFLPNININTTCSTILHKQAFDICYENKWKTPKIVVYNIDGKKIQQYHYKRKHITFRPDYQLKTKYRSYTKNYSHSGYDRGHNAENASFSYDKKLQRETFLMSNIAPQKPKLNRQVWAKIEKFSRIQAIKYVNIKVLNGVCGSLGYLKNGVNIPAYWYKILFYPNGKKLAFLAPNTNNGMSKAKIRSFIVPLSKIKNICKVDFK